MDIKQNILDGTATMSLTGSFIFDTNRAFRDSYESLLRTSGIRNLEIDLGGVDYIDSSALGMLLLLKDKADTCKIAVRLSRSKGAVKEILEVASFGRLFPMT